MKQKEIEKYATNVDLIREELKELKTSVSYVEHLLDMMFEELSNEPTEKKGDNNE